MTLDDRFERTFLAWLDDRAAERGPSYLDDVLAETRRTRQRPSWSSPGRWLPFDAVTRPLALVGAARLLVVLALLLALAAAAVLVGSRPRLPAPFGVAGNGTVVYGDGGDLYALDIEAGVSTSLITGTAEDETPDFSHDGTRFVFARRAEAPNRWLLMVAKADGTDIRAVTGPIDPIWNIWSPDDTQVLVVDAAPSIPVIVLYHLDGRPPVVLDLDGQAPAYVAFRPDGLEVVFLGVKSGMHGIYAIATAGGSEPRIIVSAVPGTTTITGPALAPDGRTLAYTRWVGDRSVIHLVDLETGEDRAIKLDAASDGENVGAWSPDATRLLFQRHNDGASSLAIAAITGGAVALLGPALPVGAGTADVVFSPDGRQVIGRYPMDASVWLLDSAGGPGVRLQLDTAAAVSWQRIAR